MTKWKWRGVKEKLPIIKRSISQFKEYNPIVDKKIIQLLKINNPKILI